MPGSNQQPNFLPQQLGPNSVGPTFFARQPVPVASPAGSNVPIVVAAYVVGEQSLARARIARNAFSPRVRTGTGLFFGPPVPPALVVSQAVETAAVARRRAAPSPRLPKLLTVPFIAPQATIASQAVERSRIGRGAPRPHIVQPVVSPVGLPAGPVVILQAIERAFSRRSGPRAHLAPRVATPAGPGATTISQAHARPYVGRRVPSPHVGDPITAIAFVAPEAIIVGQALRRPYVSRGPKPRTRLVSPMVSVPFLSPPALVVSQATKRAVLRRSGFVRLPGAVRPVLLVQAFLAPAPIVISQAQERPFVGRGTSSYAVLRTPPGLVAPLATIVAQALRRPYVGRTVPAAHLAPEVTASAGPGATMVLQAKARALVGRGAFGYTVRRGIAPHPVPVGTFVSQALQRPYAGRYRNAAPAPHLAPHVATPAGPRATIKLQAVARALVGRGGHVRVPSAAPRGPVPVGTFVSQALRRPYVGRTVPAPHLATPRKVFLAPAALVLSQATERAILRRSGSVRLPYLATQPPVPGGKFVSQAARRPYVGRGPNPKPHLASPVTKTTGPGITIKLQAVERAVLRRSGSVYLPRLGTQPPVPRGLFVSQALQRPYVGRQAARTRLAPHVATPAGPGATIKLQSQARQLRRREFKARLPILGAARPVPNGTFVSQAVARASSLVSRRGHVKLAPAVLARRKAPGTLVVSQALQRPYVGRKVIPAHLAPHVAAAAGPGATLRYQAIQRALVGRKVPPSPSLRYLPIVYPIPVPPPLVPFVTTATGLTRPSATEGLIGGTPSPRGVTFPSSNAGETSPVQRRGLVDPREEKGI